MKLSGLGLAPAGRARHQFSLVTTYRSAQKFYFYNSIAACAKLGFIERTHIYLWIRKQEGNSKRW